MHIYLGVAILKSNARIINGQLKCKLWILCRTIEISEDEEIHMKIASGCPGFEMELCVSKTWKVNFAQAALVICIIYRSNILCSIKYFNVRVTSLHVAHEMAVRRWENIDTSKPPSAISPWKNGNCFSLCSRKLK